MKVEEKPVFVPILNFFDKLIPFFALISLACFFCQFLNTAKMPWASFFAFQVLFACDVFFVLVLLIRLLGRKMNFCFTAVDILAAVSVVFTVLVYFFSLPLPKILEIFCIFRMVSALGTVFKKHSYVHNRLLCCGTIFCIFTLLGFFVMAFSFRTNMQKQLASSYHSLYAQSPLFFERLVEKDAAVAAIFKNGTIRTRAGNYVRDAETYRSLLNTPNNYSFIIDFSGDYVYAEGMVWVPKSGILILSADLFENYQRFLRFLLVYVYVLVAVFLALLAVIFDKDAKKIALINDSIDAEDYLLLKSATLLTRNGKDFDADPDEDELVNLYKMTGKILDKFEKTATILHETEDKDEFLDNASLDESDFHDKPALLDGTNVGRRLDFASAQIEKLGSSLVLATKEADKAAGFDDVLEEETLAEDMLMVDLKEDARIADNFSPAPTFFEPLPFAAPIGENAPGTEIAENTETEESAENAVRAENIEGTEFTANISDTGIAENSASAEDFQFEKEPALQDSAEKTTLEEDALAEEFLLSENENIALPKSRGGLLARAERKNDEDF
ncbi:MAG: hypothetical protein MJ196_02735 [Treponemataceae bacterium]|nr:hypothetical protein [Treponemataceae bacterium]